MRKLLHGHSSWLIGCLVGASLLGACAAPEDESAASGEMRVQDTQELREPGSPDLRVSLSAGKSVLGAGDSVIVELTLTNAGRAPARLLKWHTPVDGVEEELFQVTRDGEAAAFVGPHYKRPAPRAGDYVALQAGASLTRQVDLSDLYDFSQTGSYTIHYDLGAVRGAGKLALLKSNSVTLWIEGRATITPQAAGSVCNSTQAATLAQALSAAGGIATDSATYLNGSPAATPRYTTWFGAFSTSGWNTAKTHFVAIKDAIDTKPVTFDCGCKKNYYAYVYPSQPYKIYVCNVFWTAPMTGTDSKGGTLIHELSHFTVVAGTDDWVYGQSGAKSLAISDPTKALNNADNHEYFAENTPFQQ